MAPLINAVRQMIRSWVRVVAVTINKLVGKRLHPNMVTIAGVLLHIPIAWLIADGRFWLVAGLVLIVVGLFDTLDGELARAQKRATNNGGFLDATTDRIKEVILYTGVGYALAVSDSPTSAVWAIVACGASICVSYVRAKGETIFATKKEDQSYTDLNKLFRDGLAPFEIRMLLLVIGLVSGQLFIAVVAVAVLASLAALQRLWDISKALR